MPVESITGTLWSSILESSSKRSELLETSNATIVLFGKQGSGKSSLLNALCAKDETANNRSVTRLENSSNALLLYDRFDIDDDEKMSTSSTKIQRVHVWSANNAIFDKCYEVYSNTIQDGKVMYAVQLDMSLALTDTDELLLTVRKWLLDIQTHCNKLGFTHDSEASNSSSPKRQSTKVPTFNVPIIVIAGKCDTINGGASAEAADVSVETLRRHQELQGQLRSLCLEVGAALIYTATQGDKSKRNISTLKYYIAQKFFPDTTKIVPPLSIIDGTDCVFIPNGFDSNQLIASATGYKVQNTAPWNTVVEFQEVIEETNLLKDDPEIASAVQRTKTNTEVEIGDDQSWLQDMRAYITQTDIENSPARGNKNSEGDESAMQVGQHLASIQGGSFVTKPTSSAKEDASAFFSMLLNNANGVKNEVDALDSAMSKIRALLFFMASIENMQKKYLCENSDDLRDGHALLYCLHFIDPNYFSLDALEHDVVNKSGDSRLQLSWTLAKANLSKLVELLTIYFQNILGKRLPKLDIDTEAIARYGNCMKILPIAELVVGAAVMSTKKANIIKSNILRLDPSLQCELKSLVQSCQGRFEQVIDMKDSADTDSERIFRAEEMTRHLSEERDRMRSEIESLQRENTNLKSYSEDLSVKVSELEQIKQAFEGDGDNSLNAVANRAAILEADLLDCKRELDLSIVESDRLRESCRLADKKNEQLKETAMSRDISVQLMKDELDVAREKSARLIAAEGNLVKTQRKLESLTYLKQENKEQLELLQEYSSRISELESNTQGMAALSALVEQLKSSSVEMERAKFEALSAAQLHELEVKRLEQELEDSQTSHKRLESEFSLVRSELESMAIAAADTDHHTNEAKTAELIALRARVEELENEMKSQAAHAGRTSSPSSDVEQELLFCKAQLEQTQKEKASREELLLEAKKQLLASQAERTRAQRSLSNAQTALHAADTKLKAGREASHKLEQIQASTKMLEERLKEKETAILRLETQRRELEQFSRNKLESFKNKFMATLKTVQAEKEVLEASLERLADRAEFDRETSRREERLLLSAFYQIGVKIMDKNLNSTK